MKKYWIELGHFLLRSGFVILAFLAEKWIAGAIIWAAVILEEAIRKHPGGHVSLFTPHTVRASRERIPDTGDAASGAERGF